MSLLKRLGKILSPPAASTQRALYLYVQCDRCGEKLRARVDLWNELTPEYGEKGEDPISFHCRKVLVGENLCFQPIELSLKFDKGHRPVDKQIKGGKYIDEEEFEKK